MFTRQKTFVGMNELSAEVLEGYAAKVGKEEEQLIKRHDVKVGVASSLDFNSSFLPAALIHMHRYLGGAEEGSISLPCSFECETVLMMADISGYTALSRSLCLLGPDGVDLLSVELNIFFDTLVNAVHQHGGDVYKFAGDAVICFWSKYQYSQTIEELLQASIACSLQLIQVTHPLLKVAEAVSAADSDLDVSDVTLPESLGLHCAVGVGTMEMAGIGSPPEFIANGAPFAQVEKALSASERGELAISTEAWNALDPDDKEAYKAVDVSDGVKKLELVNEELLLDEPADPHRKFSRKELFESVAPSLWSDLLRFEPPIIQKEGQEENNNPKSAALEAAFAPDHPHAFMVTPQIRQVAIIFVNITPNKDVIRTLLDLHPILAECQATMKKNNA
jgi:class 3 adenylate cyclase